MSIDEREKALGIDSELERSFHPAVQPECDVRLAFPGYLVAVEKAHREVIGAPPKKRLRLHYNTRAKAFDEYRGWLRRRLRNPRHMFVSHILRHDANGKAAFLHNEFEETSPTTGAFLRGEEALEGLQERVRRDVDSLKPTHVFVVAMGWNNAQALSVERINAVVDGIVRHSKTDGGAPVVPLVFAVTWPSCWAFGRVGHLASYPNKAPDADEVGLTAANRLLHRVLEPVLRDTDTKLICIGHSFGSRVLSRAMFSRPLLDAVDYQGSSPVDLFIALQGAFRVHRFVSSTLRTIFKWHHFEGTPYAAFAEWPDTKFALTSSKHDHAVKAAPWTRHVGSSRALGWARKRDAHFDVRDVGGEGDPGDLGGMASNRRVLYLESSGIVTATDETDGHNNVFNDEVAALNLALLRRCCP